MSTLIPKYDLKNGGATPNGAVNRPINEKLNESVSVKDFGAKGDGTTDDTYAVNAALAAASSVYFPTGTYLVTSTIQVPANVSIYGNGLSSVIKGNFAGAVLNIGVLSGARCINVTANNLLISCGTLCDYGIQFRNVVKSNFSNLYVQSTDPCKSTFAAFRLGGEVYSNTFTGLKANIVNDPYASTNGVGFYIGNDFNAFSSSYASTNDNILIGCVSTSYNVGFWLDACTGIKLYGCNAEKGTSYAVKITGGLYNNVYNFWHEQTTSPKFYWGTSNKQNGSGGTATEVSSFCGVYDTELIGASFEMASGFYPTMQNAFLGGVSTIASGVNNAVVRDVVYAGGFSPTTSITDNGNASNIEYRDNSYNDYHITYSNGSGGETQGLQFVVTGATTQINNLYTGVNLVNAPFTPGMSISGVFYPATDNTYTLGTASYRWTTVYATTGSINTSDANQKTDIVDISDAEKRVAVKLKSSMKRFKFKDGKRYHFGTIAQDVKSAFESEGLVAEEYGVFCSDTLENGTVQFGIRYEELFAFIISTL